MTHTQEENYPWWEIDWGGEFGGTPFGQYHYGNSTKPTGRSHFGRAFCWIMVSGWVKTGSTYGETDEFGYHTVKDKVHVHDMHATMLHLLGIKHQFFTVKHQGLDWKLTGVDHSYVVKSLIA